MIFDTAENLNTYRALSPAMHTAIDWLQQTDLNATPDGKVTIDGKDIYAIVQTVCTHRPSETKYEAHHEYVDLQYMIDGEELLYVTDGAPLATATPYDAEKDIVFLEDAAWETPLPLASRRFAILFPHDAHKPCCTLGEPAEIRKCVLKIRV